MRKLLTAEFNDLTLAGVASWPERNVGFRHFSPFLIRYCDDGAFHYIRVFADRLLNLLRGDVLSSADDDVLLAIANLNVTRRMHNSQIAAVEPTATESGLGGRGILEVALHNNVSTHHHFT